MREKRRQEQRRLGASRLALAAGALGFVTLGAGLYGPAVADSLFIRDRNISILNKPRPEFQSEGVRAGQFIVRPRVDLGLGYTSNAFALSNIPEEDGLDAFEEEPDTYVMLRPSLTFDSLWSRHSLSGGVYLESYANQEFDNENTVVAGAYGDLQIDLRRSTAFNTGFTVDRLFESRRANTQVVLSADPIEYVRMNSYGTLRHEIGRLQLRSTVEATSLDFEDVRRLAVGVDGQNGEQDFRDRLTTHVRGRVGVALTRDANVFVEGAYNLQGFELDPPDVADTRDSDGWDIKVGTEFDFTDLIRGSLAAGAFQQQYDSRAFDTATGVSVDSSIEWFPREATTVTALARRGTEESALTTIGGVVTTEAIIRVDQEIRRNLIGYALAGVGQLEYPDEFTVTADDGTVREDEQEIDRIRAGAGATLYFSRHMAATLDYAYEDQDVKIDLFEGGFDTDHEIHQLLLTLSVYR